MNLFFKLLIGFVVLVAGIGLALPQMTALAVLPLILEGVRTLAVIYAPVEKT
jgi:hypothetical protein